MHLILSHTQCRYSTKPVAAGVLLLKNTGVKQYSGTAAGSAGWGAYSAVATSYMAGSTPFVAIVKTYAALGLITFTQTFPKGAANTAAPGGDKAENTVSSAFPAFRPRSLVGKTNATQRRWMAYNGWDCTTEYGCSQAPHGGSSKRVSLGVWDNYTTGLPGKVKGGVRGGGRESIYPWGNYI